jgi:hypothetical protein
MIYQTPGNNEDKGINPCAGEWVDLAIEKPMVEYGRYLFALPSGLTVFGFLGVAHYEITDLGHTQVYHPAEGAKWFKMYLLPKSIGGNSNV